MHRLYANTFKHMFLNTTDVGGSVLHLKITLQFEKPIFPPLEHHSHDKIRGELISLLGCCLINFLFEGCPVWSLWCLPPLHS